MTAFSSARRVPAALAFLGIGALAAFAPAASATPVASDMILCISDTSTGCSGGSGDSVTLSYDGTLTTSTSGTGDIMSDNTIGTDGLTVDASVGNFIMNVSTGLYDPSPGTALELSSVNVNSTGAGTLYVVFGAADYTSGGPFNELGSVTLDPGVTSATDTACYEPGGSTFKTCGTTGAPTIGANTATSTGALDFTSAAVSPTATFGLAEDLSVSFSSAGTFSGDLSLVSSTVPEPATAGLIGLGLLAAGLVGRKNRKLAR